MGELWQYTQEEFSEMFWIINESFGQRFGQGSTIGPENGIKVAVMFVVLILGYIIVIPILVKVLHLISWERKRDIALSKGHVIEAKLVKRSWSGEAGKYDWIATYEYVRDNQIRRYRAFFKEPTSPRNILHLYYIDDPRKLFTDEESHGSREGVLVLLFLAVPWVLAGIVYYI